MERIHLYEASYNMGLYTISREWGGVQKLLYIGKTKRGLFKRIKEHSYWINQYRGQIKIRFGFIEQKYSEQLLSDIESLLIILHETIENSSNIRTYKGRVPLTIHNIGRKGPLLRIASTDSKLLEDI